MWEDTFVRLAAMGTIIIIIIATFVHRRRCTEGFSAARLKSSYTAELRGRRVQKVTSIPSKRELDVVYFKVVNGRLTHNPRLPYEGLPAPKVIREFQRKFGERWVVSDTQNIKRPDRITIVFNPKTNATTKVHVPRRWGMPPVKIDLVGPGYPPLDVQIDPPSGMAFTRKTLVITTRDGKVVSATVAR